MGACERSYFCPCASTIFIWGFVYKMGGYMHAEGLDENTLPIIRYSLTQLYRLCACQGLAWKYSPHCTLLRLRGLPMSHLLEKVSTRCKSRAKARIYAASHKPQYCWWAPWVLLLLAASLTHGHVLNFVSTVIYQLISDDYVSPVQFTSVQWLVTPASTCMHWQ